MKKSKTPVAIVGAGPSGLMAAVQLARHGISFRLIEKRAGTTHLSKAMALHARSLEIYDQMGIAQTAIERGQKAMAANLMIRGKLINQIPLGDIGQDLSPFPFLLVFEQSKNEELLYEQLQKYHRKVDWNTEMYAYKELENGAEIYIRNDKGEEELVEADYVIAADGGNSALRNILKLKFEGDTYENIFYVVDTEINWSLGNEELFVNLVDSSFCAFFPMGANKFRLVGILPKKFEKVEEVSFEDIKETIKKEQEIELEFGETRWFSLYKVHHRCIENFRKGPCFFVGDSAHVHSPAGGQGMNTGLGDAYNLAWKLAYCIKGYSPVSILDSYNEERLPNALKLVSTTDRAFTTAISKGALVNFAKLNILPYLAGTVMGWESVRKLAFKRVSQIEINYRNSSIVQDEGESMPKAMPHAGDRLPYFYLYDEEKKRMQSVFKWLKTTKWLAIVFLHNLDKVNEEDAFRVVTSLQKDYYGLFETHVVHNITENCPAFASLHLDRSMLFLIRPDGHIAFIGDVENLEALWDYLEEVLHKKTEKLA